MSKGSPAPNALRALAMDAVQLAGSGHPGAPMGMAEIAEVLWTRFLKHNPANPDWMDRDRFVLSNGHASMLLYGLLHLSGYGLSMAEIRRFRQLGSKTPGHPEYGCAPGVETTTGPLGQGLANAVGMAIAEKLLAARFNRPPLHIIDHHTYCLVGDGCLMEGVSHEAASLAGTLKLGKLVCLYDDNGISIDGAVKGWFTDKTPKRFAAYGWHVQAGIDGHDQEAIAAALAAAKADPRPSLLCCKTLIGYGAPGKAGTAGAHGAPLGAEEVAEARKALDWPHPPFEIPDAIYQAWDCRAQGRRQEKEWQAAYAEYRKKHSRLAAELERRLAGALPENWSASMKSLLAKTQAESDATATRSASGHAIAQLARLLPELVGGSADLSGSNCTLWPKAKPMTARRGDANYIHYGVREFGMTAIGNGMALHGGVRPFAGTFLTFMDYAKNGVRMAALMGLPQIFVYSHDSIGTGEDGPTHQPIEQLTSLRATPNLSVWRPADAAETVAAWRAAIERRDGPSALALSRQSLPALARGEEQLAKIAKGGYTLFETSPSPDLLLIATGSEVAITLEAARLLAADGMQVRLVSMPSADVFAAQSGEYREAVLPSSVRKRLAVEAGHKDYWRKWVGLEGGVVGMDGFGESAPGAELFQHFGFTAEAIAAEARDLFAG